MRFFPVFTIVFIALVDSIAMACRVEPLDKTQQLNALMDYALAHLQTTEDKVFAGKTEDYAGDYLWTSMCPNGYQSQANVTIAYAKDPKRYCTAHFEVSLVHDYDSKRTTVFFKELSPTECDEVS